MLHFAAMDRHHLISAHAVRQGRSGAVVIITRCACGAESTRFTAAPVDAETPAREDRP